MTLACKNYPEEKKYPAPDFHLPNLDRMHELADQASCSSMKCSLQLSSVLGTHRKVGINGDYRASAWVGFEFAVK